MNSRLTDLESDVGSSRVITGAKGFFSEFWKFAAKGNAVQLAVAVVLGNAFGAIVNSLVNDIITPVISLLTNNVDLASLSYTLREPRVIGGADTAALTIAYGHLLQAIMNFLIVGLSIFLIYKLLSGVIERLQRREVEAEKEAPPEPVSTQEKLLCEIRDLLREQNAKKPGASE